MNLASNSTQKSFQRVLNVSNTAEVKVLYRKLYGYDKEYTMSNCNSPIIQQDYFCVWTERRDYYRKRDLARRYPNKHLSLIIDGTDQSKTFIPHFIGRKAKTIKTSDLLKTHITTVLNHGERQQMSFLDKGEYPHDSNMTAAILLETLWIISNKALRLA